MPNDRTPPSAETPPGAALLTPLGRGAIAVIAFWGEPAAAVIAERFEAAHNAARPVEEGRPRFGRWRIGGVEGQREEVILLRAGCGYEIHAHGGRLVAELILADLAAAGLPVSPAAAWLSTHACSSLEIEAQTALAESRTERTAAVLLDQLRGALANEIRAAQEEIARGDIPSAKRRLEMLLARGEFGLHLASPWRVVLAGRPNAGKSSLLNALLGFERALVFAEPGTTRDLVTGQTAVAGWPVELFDTAGLRRAVEPLEAAGIDRAEAAIRRADLLVLVTPAGEAPMALAHPRVLPVWSKCDLAPPPAGSLDPATSAATGAGLEELLAAIAERLIPSPPERGAAVPFTRRQIELLGQSLAALQRMEGTQAAEFLAELVQGNIS